MLTLFTILKSMDDPHIATIQRNALRSWQQIPGVEILVFGDKSGSKKVCKELGVKHLPKIATNEAGLEKVSDAFQKAWEKGTHDLMCYVNADIILPPTFGDVVASINAVQFLMVGQRHNTPVEAEWNFAPGWWGRLKAHALATGHRHTVNGIDYFGHRRGAFDPLPDLYCGRWWWDNVMIYRAQQLGYPVIDATEAVLAVHQDHSYDHVAGGLGGIAESEESLSHKRLLPEGVVPTIADADLRLIPAF